MFSKIFNKNAKKAPNKFYIRLNICFQLRENFQEFNQIFGLVKVKKGVLITCTENGCRGAVNSTKPQKATNNI